MKVLISNIRDQDVVVELGCLLGIGGGISVDSGKEGDADKLTSQLGLEYSKEAEGGRSGKSKLC